MVDMVNRQYIQQEKWKWKYQWKKKVEFWQAVLALLALTKWWNIHPGHLQQTGHVSQCFLFQACVLFSVFTESSFFIRFLYRLLTPACNNWCVEDISFCRCFLCPSNKFLILASLKIFSDQDIAKDTLLGILIGSAHCND